MTRAVCVNRSVMIAVAVIPAFSAEIASCTLHDEQLPQSPTAEMMASHSVIAARTAGGAGRLASGFFRRITAFTPCRDRRTSSTWSSNGRTVTLLLSNSPTVRPASDVRPGTRPVVITTSPAVGSRTRMLISPLSFPLSPFTLHLSNGPGHCVRPRSQPGRDHHAEPTGRAARGDHSQIVWRAECYEL